MRQTRLADRALNMLLRCVTDIYAATPAAPSAASGVRIAESVAERPQLVADRSATEETKGEVVGEAKGEEKEAEYKQCDAGDGGAEAPGVSADALQKTIVCAPWTCWQCGTENEAQIAACVLCSTARVAGPLQEQLLSLVERGMELAPAAIEHQRLLSAGQEQAKASDGRDNLLG